MASFVGLEDLATTWPLVAEDEWSRYGDGSGRGPEAIDRLGSELPAGMSRGGLVARSRELAALDRALWQARRGRSEVLILRGDPGTGKSSLLQAAMGRARDVRNVALRARLYAEGAVPAGSWPQPIIDLLEEYSPLEPVFSPESSVATAVSQALRQLAGHSLAPLLLSVDDCHLLPGWFNTALVETTRALVGTPIVILLATPALPGTPMATDEELGVRSYRLGLLDVTQSKRLLDLRADQVPAPRVLLDLVRSTGGNPEALLDVCNGLNPDELAGHRPLPDPLPLGPALVDKFARRFEGLPQETRDALTVISAGRMPLDVLKRAFAALGIAEGVLKPAERAGLLSVSQDRIEFSHPIERSAVYWLSSDDARKRTHVAVAGVLLHQNQVELAADHASRSEEGENNDLARLHFEAARIAVDGGRPEEGARHHEAASELAESNEAKAHHLVLAASLLRSVGRVDRALTYLDRATQLDPSEHLRGQAAYIEARARWSNDADRELAEEMIAAADLCQGEATDWAVMMLVDATACLLVLGFSAEAVRVADRALDLARAVGAHHEALAETALAMAASRAGQSAPPDLVAATEHLIDLTNRFQASPQMAWLIAAALLEQGHPVTTLRWAEWIEGCADRVGDRQLAAIPAAARGAVALQFGQLDAAVAASQTSVDRALAAGDLTLVAQTLGMLTSACAARGSFSRGFAAGAHQFAVSDDSARAPRIQTLVALASLELQKGRTAAAFAWLRTAHHEFTTDEGDLAVRADTFVAVNWVAAFAELAVLSRSDDDLSSLLLSADTAQREGAQSGWLWWTRALATVDPTTASSHFEKALASFSAMPFFEARLRLSWGARLADWERAGEAGTQLEKARALFASLRADGWELVARRELRGLPDACPAGVQAGEAAIAAVESEPDPVHAALSVAPAGGQPRWEITLLGSFSVFHEGRPVSLPISLAVQALKIVTLRKRISVDELVELLWPNAHPGVGNRRLRNVLWRNRVSCGDLLYRDGNFICLAREAVVDADLFRAAAERAIEAAATDTATDLVREAMALYPGELLPGDHYVDWPTARRESLAGLHMSLLDLLVDRAIEDGQTHEALGFLDRLIEADPYEERHYVRVAELHSASGNVSRALSTLSRADRTLTDLGVGPSSLVEQVRQKLAS